MKKLIVLLPILAVAGLVWTLMPAPATEAFPGFGGVCLPGGSVIAWGCANSCAASKAAALQNARDLIPTSCDTCGEFTNFITNCIPDGPNGMCEQHGMSGTVRSDVDLLYRCNTLP